MIKSYHLLILILLISFASVTGLLFTPALPSLGKDLGISDNKAQWVLSIFLIGYCIGQLPYGPLSNRFGRKKAIYIGAALAIAGSLLAYTSTSFLMLCIARLLQALGSAVGLKVSFTMISDQHEGPKATRSIALMSLAFGVTPGLAVAAGGYLTALAGWRGCFLFLTFYSLFIGFLALFLPETAKHLDREALKIQKIFPNYCRQFKNQKLIIHAFLVTLATCLFYIFAAIAPYIAMQKIGLTPAQYGLWNLFTSAGTISGGLLSRSFAERFDGRTNLLFGIVLILAGTLAMGTSFGLGVFTGWSLFLTQYAIQGGANFVWANGNAAALSSAHDKSNASAVIQFINVGGACAATFLASFFPPTAVLLLPASFAIVFLLMAALWQISKRIP